MQTVFELVREMEENDKNGQTNPSKYVSFSLRDDIERTEAYINSKHISGETDHLGREKPFFNIVVAARNIWYRATDIDRKNITLRATSNENQIPTFLAKLLLDEWMVKVKFGQFLNDWGLTLATHGSAISKFIEKNGELNCQVIDWNNIIVDAIDFDNNPKIEKLWFTPAQLRKQKNYDQEYVKDLLESETTRKSLDGNTIDNKAGYIPVYEIHGELPLLYLTGKDSDEDEYVQQMHVVTFQKSNKNKDVYEEYTLYSGREARDPYQITHLLKKDGQTYSGGAVKNLFEAQWMVNHTQKQIKDQLDLASKQIYQTSDGNFVGQNALTNIENGEILKHEDGKPLSRIETQPDVVALQNFKNDWQQVANEINGISEAMNGENPPSGTAWRQTAALLQESHSLFNLFTQNKGLAIGKMMRDVVLPFFVKQLNHSDAISAILEDHQVKQIDAMYLPNEVNRRLNNKIKQTILTGQIYDPANQAGDAASIQNDVQGNLQGNQRFIKPSDVESVTWKQLLKDVDWDTVMVDVTGEAKDTKGAMDTLSTMLQTIASNPMILQDPNAKLVFNKILDLTGTISPLELSTVQQPQQQPAQQPAMAPQPA